MPTLILDEPIQNKKPTLVLDESPSLMEEGIGPHLVLDTSSEIDETSKLESERFQKMSPLMKTLDIISRPSSAIKSVLSNIQDRNEEAFRDIPPGDVAQRAKVLSSMKPQIMDDLKAAYRGLTGKERHSMNELYAKVGLKGVPLLGFLSEIAVDPLMYGGYSAATKTIGKVAGVAGKTAMKVPLIKTVVETAKASVDPWIELFSTKSPIPKMGDMIDKWLSERHFLKGKEIQYAAQTRLAVKSIARKAGRTPKEIGQRTANIIELRNYPEELAKVVPDILQEERVLANTLQSHMSNMIVEEMNRGVPISPLSSVHGAKVDKLRKNLEVIRTQYGTELSRTRAKLVRELDVYGDTKLAEHVAKLEGTQAKIEDTAYRTHLQNVKRLDGLINDVDRQMQTLEKLKLKAVKDQAPTVITSVDKQLSKLENQFWYLHSEMADRLQDIPELAKGSLYIKQIDDIAKLLSSDIEVNLGGKGTSLAKQILAVEEKMGKLPTTPIGIPTGETRKLLKSLTVERAKREFGYFPRITTDEAKQILLSMRIGRTKLWTPKMMNALKRRTEDFTIEEFNDFVKAHGLNSLEGKTIEQFFLTDPSYAMAVRGTRSAKAVTSAGFLQETGTTFGIPLKDAPTSYIQLPDNVIKLNPSLKGLVFPQEVASEIGRVSEYYLNPSYRPDIWGKFAKHFDQVQNVWKRWQLAVFPKYHLRNAVGNFWNYFLADGDPQYYPKMGALQAYRKYRHTPYYGDLARKGLRTLGIGLDDAEKHILSMEKLGVLEHGWYASDIDMSIRQAMGGKGGISGRGMLVGRTIENNARGALYLDGVLGRSLSPEEAALRVKKYLFDYGDLTHFERTTMKRLMPFYTWTRKNIPLQLESLYKTPEKFAPISIPIRNREPLDLLRLKYANPNLYQRLPVELTRTIDTVTYVPLEGIIPAADLTKLARPQEIVWELLSPFVKEPIEQTVNRDVYSGRDIQSARGETQPYLNVEMPVRIRHLLMTVAPSARITRELDKIVTKKKNRLPLTPGEWAFSSTLSTIYKTDLDDLRKRAIGRIMGQLRELQINAAKAKREGREEAFQSIKKEMNNVVKDMRGIR